MRSDSSSLFSAGVREVVAFPCEEFVELFGERTITREVKLLGGCVIESVVGEEAGTSLRRIRSDWESFEYCSGTGAAAICLLDPTQKATLPDSELEMPDTLDTGSLVRDDLSTVGRFHEWIGEAEEAAREVDRRVIDVSVLLADRRQVVEVVNNRGLSAIDVRLSRHAQVSVVAESGGRRETMTEEVRTCEAMPSPRQLAESAARRAVTMLSARNTSHGTLPVVLAPSVGAILFHEVTGHRLEADMPNAHEVGERIAPSALTVIDHASFAGAPIRMAIDDEGNPGNETLLVQDGNVIDLLRSRAGADALQLFPTGNGRRVAFSEQPLLRMTNTVVLNASDSASAILGDVRRGLYVRRGAIGQVDFAARTFVLGIREGYVIDRGRLSQPVSGAVIADDPISVLHRVRAVADDLEIVGVMCRKTRQDILVGAGSPTMLISPARVAGDA